MEGNDSKLKRVSQVFLFAKIVVASISCLLLFCPEIIVSWERIEIPVRINCLFFLKVPD